MQQIADWLEELGLGQYAQRFAENDISFAVLPDLTDQDLKEIGLSLGHRRQLLRAIADLPSGANDGPEGCRCDRSFCRLTRHCRAPSSHGGVLGPRRVY